MSISSDKIALGGPDGAISVHDYNGRLQVVTPFVTPFLMSTLTETLGGTCRRYSLLVTMVERGSTH